jgi:hypothetical protein
MKRLVRFEPAFFFLLAAIIIALFMLLIVYSNYEKIESLAITGFSPYISYYD